MKIIIDPTLCKAEARCYTLYPNLFEANEEDKGRVRATASLDDLDTHFDAQAAANQCPRGAIRIEE